jgi:hypothetical protein
MLNIFPHILQKYISFLKEIMNGQYQIKVSSNRLADCEVS